MVRLGFELIPNIPSCGIQITNSLIDFRIPYRFVDDSYGKGERRYCLPQFHLSPEIQVSAIEDFSASSASAIASLSSSFTIAWLVEFLARTARSRAERMFSSALIARMKAATATTSVAASFMPGVIGNYAAKPRRFVKGVAVVKVHSAFNRVDRVVMEEGTGVCRFNQNWRS